MAKNYNDGKLIQTFLPSLLKDFLIGAMGKFIYRELLYPGLGWWGLINFCKYICSRIYFKVFNHTDSLLQLLPGYIDPIII